MPWIKVDDHYDEHRKFADAGPFGVALWLAGIAYCNRNLTDGYIPWGVARNLVSWEWLGAPDDGRALVNRAAYSYVDDRGEVDYEDITSQHVIDVLLRVGLWTNDGYGYRVHDYTNYQPTKAQVEADRAAKVAAGQAGGRASAQARGQAPASAPVKQTPSKRSSEIQAESNPVPVPVPVPQDSAPPDGGAESPRARNGVDIDVVELQLLAEQLTQHPYVMQNIHSGLGHKAVGLMRKHGRERVEAEWNRIAEAEGGMPTLRQLVLGADDILNPLRQPERLTGKERRDSENADLAARIRAEAAAAQGGRA